MNHTQHKWKSLDYGYIDVIKIGLGVGKAQSLFRVIEICTEQSCTAGRTADGVVIMDVRSERMIEGELVNLITKRFKTTEKE